MEAIVMSHPLLCYIQRCNLFLITLMALLVLMESTLAHPKCVDTSGIHTKYVTDHSQNTNRQNGIYFNITPPHDP